MSSAPGRKIELVHWVPHGTFWDVCYELWGACTLEYEEDLLFIFHIGTWSWTLDADSCSICRNSLMSMCIECTASPKDDFTKQSCSVTWGECGHAFHTHCISKWLKQRNSCPIGESCIRIHIIFSSWWSLTLASFTDNADWTVKQVSSAISGWAACAQYICVHVGLTVYRSLSTIIINDNCDKKYSTCNVEYKRSRFSTASKANTVMNASSTMFDMVHSPTASVTMLMTIIMIFSVS
jgi:RING-box protein 1